MESSEIEAFLALAEELDFGRTAERLRLSQSRVSRLIASLEARRMREREDPRARRRRARDRPFVGGYQGRR